MVRIEHISHQTGDTWRIDVVVTGQAFSGIELKGSPGFYIDTFEDLNRAEPFSNPVQASRAEVEVYVQTEGERGALATILGANEGSYQIESYRNGQLYKRYTLLPDLCRFDEGDFPYAVTLVGKDTTGFESSSYGLFDDRVSLIEAIGFALGNVPIRTRTSWYHGDQADDFVRNTYIDRYQLRRLSDRDDQPDAPLSKLEVLSNIARAFKLFIRQHNGAWWIDQVSAYLDPTQVTQANFTGSVFFGQSVVNTAEVTNTDTLKVVRGSSGEQIPAYRQITSTFDHRQRAIGISFDSFIRINEGEAKSFEQFYSSQGGVDFIQLSGRVKLVPFEPIPATLEQTYRPRIGVQIRVGSRYWDNDLGEWSATPYLNRIGLSPRFGGSRDDREIIAYETDVQINTELVPATLLEGEQFIRVILTAPEVQNVVSPLTGEFTEFEFNLDSPNQSGRSQAIVYQSERSIGGVVYDDRGRLFGDGPTDWATSAIRDSTGAVITDWFRRGVMDVPVSHALLVHDEIAGFHRNPVTLLSAVIRGSFFDLSKTLIYRLQPYFFIGGRLDAFAGEQTYTFAVNAWAKVVQDFNVSFVRPGSFVQSALLSAVRLSRAESWDAEGSAVFRLVVPVLEGATVTGLLVEGETEALEGQVIRVVNPFTLASQEFEVARDKLVEDSLLVVESSVANASYPSGSYLFLSARSVQAGILAGEDSVRIFAEANSIGVLTADVDGVVTSLAVRLYTRVRAGQDLEVIGFNRRVYRFTVAEDYDAGVRTINIDEFGARIIAFAGSIIIGNPVSTQAEFNVSPGEVAFGVEAEGEANAFGRISSPVAISTIDELPVTIERELTVLDGQTIMVIGRAGITGAVTVVIRGNQTLTTATTTLNIESIALPRPIQNTERLVEPAWSQSSRITVNANSIELVVEASNEAIEAISGLSLTVGTFEQDITTVTKGNEIGQITQRIGWDIGNFVNGWDVSAVIPPVTAETNWFADTAQTSVFCVFRTPGRWNIGDTIEFIDNDGTILATSTLTAGSNVPETTSPTSTANATLFFNSVTSIRPVDAGTYTVRFVKSPRSVLRIKRTSTATENILLKSGQPLILAGVEFVVNADVSITAQGVDVTLQTAKDFLPAPPDASVVAVLWQTTKTVNEIGARAVLGVDVNGNIASLTLSSGAFGANAVIKANQITLDGQATFINNLGDALDLNALSIANVNIMSASQPATRPDGSSLQPGDIWTNITEGNKPWVYRQLTVGPPATFEWQRAYTAIDGGDITTGTINAQRLSVTQLSSLSANLGTVTAGDIEIGTGAKIFLKGATTGDLDIRFAIGGTTIANSPFKVAQNGFLSALGGEFTGKLVTGTGSSIDGGFIVQGTVTADRLNAGVITSISSTISTDQTFLDNVAAAIGDVDFDVAAITVYESDTTPTAPAGGFILGDVWLDTTVIDGVPANLPNVWNGSAWVRLYTKIDGGQIATGSIDANRIKVNDLFAQTISVEGSLTAYNDPNNTNDNFVRLDANGISGVRDGTTVFLIPTDPTENTRLNQFLFDDISFVPREFDTDEPTQLKWQGRTTTSQIGDPIVTEDVDAFYMGVRGLFFTIQANKEYFTSSGGPRSATGLVSIANTLTVAPDDNWLSVTVGNSGTGSGYVSARRRLYANDPTVSGNDRDIYGLIVNKDIRLQNNTTTTTATSGISNLPSNPQGFLSININGTVRKIPFYNQ
jgi:hypothetical protein